jgi:probable rRNA maturation factor
MLDLVFNNFAKVGAYKKDFFEKCIQAAVKTLDLEGKVELSINLVDEAKMKALNKEHRGKDKPTDVLSFPLLNKPIGANLQRGGIMDAGDVFICFTVARKEAIKEGLSLDFKLKFLVIHGFLHLLGYDHEESAEAAKKMVGLESKVMKALID